MQGKRQQFAITQIINNSAIYNCMKFNILTMIIRLEQVRRQSNIADSLNTDMTDILREKDETIAQLEEKLIENDQKMEELRGELRLVFRCLFLLRKFLS